MNKNKAPICRFYQKGYCRYGRSCRFQHPGEENNDTNQATDYSFKTGFSFTRALESTLANNNDIDMSDTPSIFSQTYQQLQQQQSQQKTQHINSSFSPFSFQQKSPQQQQQTSISGIFSPFSFQQRQQQQITQLQQQQTLQPQINNIFSPFSAQPQQNHQVVQQQNLQYHPNHLPFQQQQQIQPPQQQIQQQELSEAELKAFQSDRFEFRKIPVRPPPPALC